MIKPSNYELFVKAIIAGKARWEPFNGDLNSGEICCNGLRYSTKLKDGIPILHEVIAEALQKALNNRS